MLAFRQVSRVRFLHSSARIYCRKEDGKDKNKEIVIKEQKEKAPSAPETKLAPRGKQQLIHTPYVKPLESSYVVNRPMPNGFARALDQLKPRRFQKTQFRKRDFDHQYDVCIIGGGVMGCSAAYFLASHVFEGLKICVIERDPTYRKCSTTLSVGGMRQQFSLPENVEMSLFGADFLRHADRLLHVNGMDNAPVNFQPHGYLFLASEDGVDIMEENYHVQIECGAKVELLSPKRLKNRFPWINTDGVALASYGYENEGWFDPWALMTSLKMKAMELGVTFIHGEVYNMAHKVNVDREYSSEEELEDESKRMFNRVIEAHVHLADGDVWPIDASTFVIAAGAQSGHIAHLCGIGSGTEMLNVPCPVEPRKRYVYCVHVPDGPGLNCPLVIDPTGAYLRREGYGGHYLVGRSPPAGVEEPGCENMDVDYEYFDEHVWPAIANRVPAFNNLKVKSAWSGYYDYNFLDQNAIVGRHPFHQNVLFATGFSGHGIQQAPAIGRAIAELVIDLDYTTIDLSRFSFDRVLVNKKILESNIV